MDERVYHVAGPGYEPGDDLLSLAEQVAQGYLSEAEAIAQLQARWPEAAADYIMGDGAEIHCHTTRAEADAYALEYGGRVVAIDAETLDVRSGAEYPHPVVLGRIPAEVIRDIGA